MGGREARRSQVQVLLVIYSLDCLMRPFVRKGQVVSHQGVLKGGRRKEQKGREREASIYSRRDSCAEVQCLTLHHTKHPTNGCWVCRTQHTEVILSCYNEESVSDCAGSQHNSCPGDNVDIGPLVCEELQLVVKSALTIRKLLPSCLC